jgi:hypothetical protein
MIFSDFRSGLANLAKAGIGNLRYSIIPALRSGMSVRISQYLERFSSDFSKLSEGRDGLANGSES